MAQNKYCPKCGKPTAFVDGVTPKFCGSCGCEFAAAFKVEPVPHVPAPVIRPAKKKKYIEVDADEDDEDEDGDEYYSHPPIVVPRKFEFEINLPKKVNIGDVRRGEMPANGVSANLPQIPN